MLVSFVKGDCSLPPLEYETSAFWIDIPLLIKRALQSKGVSPLSAIHAANHAILAVGPMFAQCDSNDLDTEHIVEVPAAAGEHTAFRIMVNS